MLGRDRLWSQGDQLCLFVIPWLCQLPGTVPGPGLQLSTASASWIPPQALPTSANQGSSVPLPFPSPLLTPGATWGASLAWQGLSGAFCSLASPGLQGFVTSRGCGGLSPSGPAGVCHLQVLQVCPSSILIFQPPKFPFSFLFLSFCGVFLHSAQICSSFQSI